MNRGIFIIKMPVITFPGGMGSWSETMLVWFIIAPTLPVNRKEEKDEG